MTPRTNLQQVRSFLVAQQAAPPAWSTGAEAVDALYRQLRRRQEPAFWSELAALLGHLEDPAVDPDLLGACDALDRATTQELVAALRQALAEGDDAGSARAWARGLVDPRSLALFLLLGVATGCPAVPADVERCDEVPATVSDANVAVYCELVDLARGSDAGPGTIEAVIDCLPSLSDARRVSLVEAFRDATPEELVDLLTDLRYDECDEPWDDDDAGH